MKKKGALPSSKQTLPYILSKKKRKTFLCCRMSLLYVPSGSWTFTSNVPYYPTRSNFLCRASSLESRNQTLLLNTLSPTGYYQVSENTTYDITLNFAPADIGYTGNGTIGLMLLDTNNQQYTLASSGFINGNVTTLQRNITLQSNFFVYIFITLAIGGTYSFSPSVSTNSYWRIDLYKQIRGVIYNNVTSGMSWAEEERTVRLVASLTSGYKVSFNVTHDSTPTGLPIFKRISSAQATAMPANPVNSSVSAPWCAIDSISADLRTVVVNVITGTTVTTLLASSQITTTAAPVGTWVHLSLWGI